MPLGATEDRICGTIDIEKALTEGIKAYEPGLLVGAVGCMEGDNAAMYVQMCMLSKQVCNSKTWCMCTLVPFVSKPLWP